MRAPAFSLLCAGVFAAGCIAPEPKCACAEGAGTSESSGSTESTATAALDVETVDPNGALIWDGASISILNVDPPGSWFIFNDGSPKGTMVPASTGEFEQHLENGAIHSKGSGFGEWGGGIGMNFVGAQMLQPVNGKRYKGLTFKASGSGVVHFAVATVITMPEFGVCTTCYDHYAADITLTGEMKTYEFTWDQLRQAGWGAPKATMDPGTLVGLNFTSKGPTAWDFVIDDVAFLE